MESVKQTLIVGVIALITIAITVLFSADKDIATDEAFQVTSDTSNYSCIVSEVESELSLKCLEVN